MRLDLVTHCRALLLPPRPPLGANARAACAPSVLSLFSEHPKAVGAIPVSEGSVETDRVVGQDDGGPGASHRRLLPATRDDAEPLTLLRKHRRKTSKINAFNRSRAARSTRGDSACAKPQHATRSNIHSGISRQRAAPSAVSAHRNVRLLPLVITSGRTHAGQTRGARDKILPVLRSCGRYALRCTTRLGPTPQSDTDDLGLAQSRKSCR
jgi:hypothetical protein